MSDYVNTRSLFGYYILLAVTGLRRNAVLASLMIGAIGIGIAACTTTLTIYRAMAGDPIPDKASQLFAPQIDSWGPAESKANDAGLGGDGLPDQLSYTDAVALMRAHAAPLQAAMYETTLDVTPPDSQRRAFQALARATYADFFRMFGVPFLYGGPWSSADDETHSPSVVITRSLNERLFSGNNSVGRVITLNGKPYRIVGVIGRWRVVPHFYDMSVTQFGGVDALLEQVFLPFTVAIDRHLSQIGKMDCTRNPKHAGEAMLLSSDCVWIQFWVELPTAAGVHQYRSFLLGYAASQQNSGPPRIALRDVPEWLRYEGVVTSEISILVAVSFSLLGVCLFNAAGLLLVRFMARATTVGIRRALGASRGAILAQCVVESALIGLGGGLLGLGLSVLGLAVSRLLLPPDFEVLTQLQAVDIVIAVTVGIGVTALAGLYPAWRAAHIAPSWQLKAT